MKTFINNQDELTRRAFMARAASAFLGVSVAPSLIWAESVQIAHAPEGPAKQVIYIYLAGGMSHLDTFDPKPGKEEMGPVETIKTNVDGIQLSQHLPEMAKRMDRVALIRSMKTTQGDHERGNYIMHTAYMKRGTIQHPSLGAWSANIKGRINPTMPANILIGGGSKHPGAGFFDARNAPVPIGDPSAGLQNSALPKGVTEEKLEKRLALVDQFDHEFHKEFNSQETRAYADLYSEALKLMKSEDLAAFDLGKEPETDKSRYAYEGRDAGGGAKAAGAIKNFGLGCLLARRLVEHGVRFVEVNFGGWDTHTDNFDRVEDLAGALDRALSALLDDLQSRGLLKTTLVAVATEFGRTPKINETEGRNHHPQAFSCVLAGGGIKGGVVHGKTDETGDAVAENEVTVQDFHATIARAQGIPLDQVVHSPSGRPFTVADKGKPVTALFA